MAKALKQQNQKEWAYFSDTLPADLAQTVRGIVCDDDSFTTHTLSFDDNNSCIKTTVQLEAHKRPGQNNWTVTEHKTTAVQLESGNVDETHTSRPVLSNTCFFDALYYCARFEQSELKMGSQIITNETNDNIQHYITVGEKAGQPFDSDTSLPVPAAYGDTLLEGNFSADPRKLTRKTKHKALVPHERIPFTGIQAYNSKNMPPVTPEENIVLNAQNRRDHIENLGAVKNAGDKLSLAFFRSIHADFNGAMTKGEWAMISAITVGIMPIISWARAEKDLSTKRHFQRALKSYNKTVASLPESKEKHLCQEFGKAAAFAYEMERATCRYKEAQNNTRKKRKALKQIEKAATTLSLSPADTQALEKDCIERSVQGKDYRDLEKPYYKNLVDLWETKDDHSQTLATMKAYMDERWTSETIKGVINYNLNENTKEKTPEKKKIKYLLDRKIEQIKNSPAY